jgi:hypothetical protein
MVRTLRLAGAAVAAVAVMGLVSTAAFAGPGCGSSAKASTKASYCTDSALSACASKAKLADTGCCASTANKMANLAPFKFVNTAKEQDVAVGVQTTETGFAFVFAGGTEVTIASAKKLATESVASLNKPAGCSSTRGEMAKASSGCSTTQACLSALADAKIEVVETDNGALTTISSDDEAKIQQLHEFLKSFAQNEVKTEVTKS